MTKEEIKNQIHSFAELMYKTGYEDGKNAKKAILASVLEENYKKGLNDAWKCAKKVMFAEREGGLSINEYTEIFGNTTAIDVMKNYTASEAIAKIKEYEDKKNEIHVGDEVVSDAFDEKGIVTHITDKSCVSLICGMTSMISTSLDKIHKTGKSYPQIVEILEQLKGDKE